MKRWGYLLTFVGGALFAVVLGLTTSATFKASIVAAQQTEKASSQKWEYCAVRKKSAYEDNFGRWRGSALIQYFQAEGTREEEVWAQSELGLKSLTAVSEDARAKALAKLGNEGWEMVGIEVTGEKSGSVTYILKRPKQ